MKFISPLFVVHYVLGLLIGIDSLCAARYEIHNAFRYVLLTFCVKTLRFS